MTDRDAVINGAIDYVCSVGSQMLGFAPGSAGKALAKVLLNNYIENNGYGNLVAAFFDKEGNFLTDSKTYFGALKEFMSQKPIEAFGLRFNHKDVDELQKYFDKYTYEKSRA